MFRQASSAQWRIVVASAMAQMGIACWEYDLHTGELWWSDNAGPLLGRPSGFTPADFEEANGLFLPDVRRPRDLGTTVASLAEGAVEVERQALLPDGSARWTYHRYFVMVDPDGRPQRLAGLMTDIEQRKRRELEYALLLNSSEVLTRSLGMSETLAAIARLVVPEVADWCVVELADENRLRPVVTAHVDPDKVAWAEAIQAEYPQDLESPIGAPHVIRTGEAELYPDISDDMLVAVARGDERLLEILRSVGYRSMMLIPLSVRGETIGAVSMVMAESGRRFDRDSIGFAKRLAAQMAVAIDSARLLEGLRAAIDTLQQGLSPGPLPHLPSIGLAAHYEVGGTHEVGGDWYDVFRTERGAIALVIGDVVGRGVPAVAAMSRFRHSLNTLLMEGHQPGAAVGILNRVCLTRGVDGERFATLVCITYDPEARLLRSAQAGHPTPLLRHPGGGGGAAVPNGQPAPRGGHIGDVRPVGEPDGGGNAAPALHRRAHRAPGGRPRHLTGPPRHGTGPRPSRARGRGRTSPRPASLVPDPRRHRRPRRSVRGLRSPHPGCHDSGPWVGSAPTTSPRDLGQEWIRVSSPASRRKTNRRRPRTRHMPTSRDSSVSLRVDSLAGGIRAVRLAGELDLGSAHLLTEEVDRLVEGGETRIVIDATGLTFVDSTGLHTLLSCQNRAGEDGRSFHVVPSEALTRLFEITQADTMFQVFPSVRQAAAALRYRPA